MAVANPAIPGFAPDPSIVRVDGTYFLVNSTFHLFPGLPIYASTDLASWKCIAHVFSNRARLDLGNSSTSVVQLPEDAGGRPLVATGGLYAPTIRYHAGTFYVFCTNVCHGESDKSSWSGRHNNVTPAAIASPFRNFFCTCTDIWAGSSAWNAPVYYDFHGIDPSLFIDDDGRAYVQGCQVIDYSRQPSCSIQQFEMDLKTGAPLSPARELWAGAAQIDPEGPHVYKRDGLYYLLIAEGGTFQRHQVSVARSPSIWGPYEVCPHNPILTAESTSNVSDGIDSPSAIQHTGHADLFTDESGQWLAMLLGVRKEILKGTGTEIGRSKEARKRKERIPLGRETFLTKVTWQDDGWPRLGPVEAAVNLPWLRQSQRISPGYDLDSGDDGGFVFLRNSDPAVFFLRPQSKAATIVTATATTNADVTVSPGSISLIASLADLSEPQHRPVAFAGRRQRGLKGEATVVVALDSSLGHDKTPLLCGLAVYKDELRYARLIYNVATGEVTWECVNRVQSIRRRITASRRILPISSEGDDDISPVAFSAATGLNMGIRHTATAYTFWFSGESASSGSSAPTELASIDTADLSDWDFTGPIIGVFATEPHNTGRAVTFRNFHLRLSE